MEGKHRGHQRLRQAAEVRAGVSRAAAGLVRRPRGHDLDRSGPERDHRPAPPVPLKGENVLDGMVPFPPEYAKRYRDKGYWRGRSLAQEFAPLFERYADRIAVVDRGKKYTYAEIDRASDRLALNLLDAGLAPLDRVVVQLPNVVEFVFLSLSELISREPKTRPDRLRALELDPTEPAIFQLSGGTTGVPKLIPRTHNDYAYNSRIAVKVCGVTGDSVLLLALPIAHNLPLACPGLQGTMLQGGKVVLSASTKPEDLFGLIERHRVTHLKVVPALLIRLINDPAIGKYDLSSLRIIQSGGQRMQPEVRVRTKQLIPSVTVQENFGMSEGMLFFVRLDDPEDVRMET